VRGADGLGSPEVIEEARGSVVLRGGVRLGAEITEVTPGRSWSWRVGGLEIHHIVESRFSEAALLQAPRLPATRRGAVRLLSGDGRPPPGERC
jgi:hypothetical protein